MNKKFEITGYEVVGNQVGQGIGAVTLTLMDFSKFEMGFEVECEELEVTFHMDDEWEHKIFYGIITNKYVRGNAKTVKQILDNAVEKGTTIYIPERMLP